MTIPTTLSIERREKGNNTVSSVLKRYTILASPSPVAFQTKLEQIGNVIDWPEVAMVFTDVLRATTTLTAIAATGCYGMQLCVKPADGDYDLKPPAGNLPGEWVFGGEKNGKAIPGGVIGNSPLSVTKLQFTKRYLRFYSTNGARALDAINRIRAGGVFLMSLANIEATVDAILAEGFGRVWFVNGGFYGNGTLEDNVCAGRAIASLAQKSRFKLEQDDEAVMMRKVAESYGDDNERLISDLINGQVAGVLKSASRLEDIPASINGTGMERLWNEMKHMVIRLKWIGDTPLLVSNM